MLKPGIVSNKLGKSLTSILSISLFVIIVLLTPCDENAEVLDVLLIVIQGFSSLFFHAQFSKETDFVIKIEKKK